MSSLFFTVYNSRYLLHLYTHNQLIELIHTKMQAKTAAYISSKKKQVNILL